MTAISASILAADLSHLYNECEAVLAAGADSIHFDVMDHHFVPNLSFGAPLCASLRKAGLQGDIEVHLMVEHPEKYVQPFAKAGASALWFHPETHSDPASLLAQIRAAGMSPGLVLNPDVPLTAIESYWSDMDTLLLMSVQPGFGGQSFMGEVLDKIRMAKAAINTLPTHVSLAVDGGIKCENAGAVAAAGADCLIVGSGLMAADDYHQRIQELKSF